MRRTIAIGSLVLLLLGLALPAQAQPALMGPGGVLNSSGASVTITNSSTATAIYAYAVPAGFVQGNYAPLHVKIIGRITTSLFPGAVNLGCNYGGSTASLTLMNGITPTASLSNAPLTIDLWMASASAAQANGIQQYLQGRTEIIQAAGTPSVWSHQVQGTTARNVSANQMLCTWQWGSASTGNSVEFINGKTVVGE